MIAAPRRAASRILASIRGPGLRLVALALLLPALADCEEEAEPPAPVRGALGEARALEEARAMLDDPRAQGGAGPAVEAGESVRQPDADRSAPAATR